MTRRTLSFTLAAGLALLAACRTAPKSSEDRADLVADAEEALDKAKAADPAVEDILDEAVAVAVFPTVGKGAAGVGGAYGRGVLFEGGRATGYCDLTQGTVGLQLGGQKYTEIICFENERAVERFKDGDFAFSAQATAVAIESGAGANAAYTDGVCVLTMDEKGLMFETAVGGQKFSFKPMSEVEHDEDYEHDHDDRSSYR